MSNIIAALANGAVKKQLRLGITDPVAIEVKAFHDCLVGFVKINEDLPATSERKDNKAAMEYLGWKFSRIYGCLCPSCIRQLAKGSAK